MQQTVALSVACVNSFRLLVYQNAALWVTNSDALVGPLATKSQRYVLVVRHLIEGRLNEGLLSSPGWVVLP
jgi:hypothetical protein